MKTVNAYINFDGNCRQAMSFYQQCLDAKLDLNPYPDQTGKPSEDPAARILHAQLVRDGAPFLMASDTSQPGTLRAGNNVSVALDCSTLDEAQRTFDGLSQNGEIRMPLTKAPWGAHFGMLTDQFGIQWMLNCQDS